MKSGAGFELELFDGNRNAVGARSEFGAVDAEHLAGIAVVIDHEQASGDVAAFFFRDESQLFAIDAKVGFDVVHDGVGFRLLGEAGFLPVFGNVVRFSFGGDVVVFDQFLGERDHAQRLGESLDGIDGERALLFLPCHFEKAALRLIPDIGQGAHREFHGRFFARHDLAVNIFGGCLDRFQNLSCSRPSPFFVLPRFSSP